MGVDDIVRDESRLRMRGFKSERAIDEIANSEEGETGDLEVTERISSCLASARYKQRSIHIEH
jgi:hypothetical protein